MAGDFISAFSVGNESTPVSLSNLAVDAVGNQYATGWFRGTMDFAPSEERADGSDILTSQNGTLDAFVAKYAADNSLVWVRRMGGAADDSNVNVPWDGGRGISVDGSGNVFVVGDFKGTADFGSQSLTSAGLTDCFLTKLDGEGNFLWTKAWGTSDIDRAEDVALDQEGNVVVVGEPRPLASSGGFYWAGMLVGKYSTAGASRWSVRIDNLGGTASSVSTDASGNAYVAGTFNGTVDFNPDPKRTANVAGVSGLSGGTGYNAYVLKLSSLGSYQAVTPVIANLSTNSSLRIADIQSDASGQITAAGTYRGAVDFDPGKGVNYLLPTTTASAGYAARLDAAGKWMWATSLGVDVSPNRVISDASGIYVAGYFWNTFQPTSSSPAVLSQGGNDVFLVSLSNAGAVQWSTAFGGAGSDIAYGLAVTADSIYLGGTFSRTMDVNPDPLADYTLQNDFYGDFFVVKLTR